MWAAPLLLDVLGRVLVAQLGTGTPAPAPVVPPSVPPVTAPTPAADGLAAWAGEPRVTTLPEVLQSTVQHSPALASAKLDIAIAEARIEQTYSRDDWHLQAQLSAGRTTGFISGLAIARQTSIAATGDIYRGFSTGGTLNFHVASRYTSSDSSGTGPVGLGSGTSWYDEISATYTQPLLRNRGRFLYEANARRATIANEVSTLARRNVAIRQIQTVVSAYWDLVLAERQVAIAEASLDLARERLRVTQIGVDGGKTPRSELPAVQQIIATREEEVLTTELAVIERSLTLRRAAGMPIGVGEVGLRVAEDLGIDPHAWELGPLIERAYTASPELAQLDKQDAAATIDVEVAANGLLTRLDAALTIGPTGQQNNALDAATSVVKLEAMTYLGTLTLQHDFGNQQAHGIYREQQVTQRKLAVTALDVRAQLAQTMAQAVAQLELARRRVTLSERAIELANQNIKLESDRFSLGKSTNFDVLNRQEDLRQANLRQAQAMIDWHKAESTVQALTGDLLPTYGITLE